MKQEIETKKLDQDFTAGLNNRIGISMINIGLSVVSKKNNATSIKKIQTISSYLKNKLFKDAYSTFDFSNLEPHWYVYFCFCKIRFGIGAYLVLLFMRFFTNK
jgi:hypothetical protein